ncbi:site-specific recombinase [Neisseria shayeganii 871]|uniref:Site-specific recombinase n=1 Tax=Neisseria shayeganii 871 TaxID=1032488 RepID=G4CH55_9NEIS|nr:site-specific recombinase [Neisseria shayeganii 871]
MKISETIGYGFGCWVRPNFAKVSGHIYKLLSNRTYLGELRHKDQWYQAEHPPIVSREL